MTQLRPRFTGERTSPWVATTRPARVATMTEHPVPQKRQGAFDQVSPVRSAAVTRFRASAGRETPATAAATLAALAFNSSRRVNFALNILRFLTGSPGRGR